MQFLSMYIHISKIGMFVSMKSACMIFTFYSFSRELMSGADTLKNVAEVLQFIDRISEVRQH